VAEALPAPEVPVEPPRPRRTHAPLVARTATPLGTVQPVRDILPERIAPPTLDLPVAAPSPRTASALLPPSAPVTAAPAHPQPDPEPPVITNSPEASVDAPAKDKKDGNRFFRALHKIKLFHKNSSETQDPSNQ